jgi:hypothetical protein
MVNIDDDPNYTGIYLNKKKNLDVADQFMKQGDEYQLEENE